MPGEFTLGEATLGETAAAIAGPPPSTSLGPSALIDKQDVKARWGERYTSEVVNKKFLGMPRGVYYGFVPSTSGLRLTLAPDISVTYANLTGAPVISETITGATSGATATIRVISPGFLLIDTVDGLFQVGEQLSGGTSGFGATLTSSFQEGISFARVTSNTPLIAGRSEHMVSIITTDSSTLDFTGFSDGIYFIYMTASYSIGASTIGSLAARTTPPPNQTTEVLVCQVTKIGSAITVQATSPTTRQEPFASVGQRIGFMPGGSVEALLASVLTTQEVIASRQATDGSVAPVFDLAFPQTTGLPKRLADDLSRASMASRLGKSLIVTRGNDYAVGGAISAPLNVSGSFAARTRDHQPFRDVTNEDLPVGIRVPLILAPYASDNTTLTISNVVGSFGVGETLIGDTSNAEAVIRAVSGTTLELNEVKGVFQPRVTTITMTGVAGTFTPGEVIYASPTQATATVLSYTNSILSVVSVQGTFVALDTIFGTISMATGVYASETSVFETVSSVGPPAGSADLEAADLQQGAITAEDGGPGGDAVRNLVSVVDTFTGRKPVDGVGNPIFGRLLFGPSGTSGGGGGDPGELLVGAGISEQINFVQGSTTVTNNSINFTLFCLPGDIIEGADGRWYEIAAAGVTSTTLTLTAGKPYLGSNASAGNGVGPGPRRRRRYLLRFVSKTGGVESQQTVTPGTTIPSGSALRPFFNCWLPGDQSNYSADLDVLTPGGAYALSSAAVPGVAYNASGLGGGSGVGSPVVGAIRTMQQSGVTVGDGNFHTINFTTGTIAQAAPGVLNITAAGPQGPPGSGGGGGGTGPTGPAGAGYTTIFPYQSKEVPINAFGITNSSIGFTFSSGIRFYMVNSGYKNAANEVDTGVITGVTAVSGNSGITVNYRLDGGAGGLPQVMVIGAAAAA